jgi:hypothetical protein
MRVESGDNPLEYLVESRSELGAVHKVDFSGEYPECSCDDWHFRRNPRIKQGAAPQDEQCQHIKAVCSWVGWNALMTMSKEEREK